MSSKFEDHTRLWVCHSLRQDRLSRNLPIPPMLKIWSLPDVPQLVISAIFIVTDIKNLVNILIQSNLKANNYFFL